jgi:hypothetical protein
MTAVNAMSLKKSCETQNGDVQNSVPDAIFV